MSGRPWTDEEERQLLELIESETPRAEIARILGRSYPSVVSHMHYRHLSSQEARRRQISVTQKSRFDKMSKTERENWSKHNTREARGLALPKPYEEERNRLKKRKKILAEEADRIVKEMMKRGVEV